MEVLFLISFAWWFANFEPLQLQFDRLFLRLKVNIYTDAIYASVSCMKCLSFWFALFYFQDFFMACFVSLIGYTIQLCLQKLK